jgi:peptide/nickel transport system substrate-binding protein
MKNFLKNFFIKLKNKEDNLIKRIQKHIDWEKKLLEKLGKKTKKIEFPKLKQIKYFPSVLKKEEKIIFTIFSLIFIIALTILSIRYYLSLPNLPARGGKYREGVVGQVSLINPIFGFKNEIDQDLIKLIFSGLVKIEGGEIKPDLAERWEIKENGKVYKFWLKKKIFWHDGKPLTTDDIVFTFKIIKDKKLKSPLRDVFENVRLEKKDDGSIEFILEKPFSPFLTLLNFGILPKHLWENIPREKFIDSDLNLKPIGSGPFKFKEISFDENGKIRKIVLQRNKKYHLSIPYLDEIHFKFFDSYNEAFEALITKRIDGLSYQRVVEKIGNVPKIINFYKIPLSFYTALFLNQKSENLSSKKIRKALAYSLNKEEIIKEFENAEIIDSSIVNPDFKFNQVEKYNYSLPLAKKLLNEAGYIKKKDWYTDKRGKILELDLVVLDNSIYKKVGEIIKNFWEKIGIKTNLKILKKEDFEKAISERKYDVLLFGIIEGYDPDPFSLWHSSQINNGMNLANFKDIKVDVDLEKARMTFNKEERKKYYQEFQKIISEELPAIFLYQVDLIYLQNKEINSLIDNFLFLPSDRFSHIENWYIFTTKGK